MSNMMRDILRQRLMEIQSQLPPFVKIIKEASSNFDDILNNEVNSTSPVDINNNNDNDNNKNFDSTQYDSIINDSARKYNLNSNIIKAVIKAESGFNSKAVSPVGAMGLMQLMPDTAAGLGIKDAFDPQQNIDAGVRFLKDQLNEFGGDLQLALAAYNAGPGNVKKYGGIPPFDETENYVKKIMSYLKK